MILRSLLLVAVLFQFSPAFAVETQRTLSTGIENQDKWFSGKTNLFLKGQYAAQVFKVLNANLAVTVTRPNSTLWFEGKAGVDFYPLRLLGAERLGFLPFLGAGAITRNSATGKVVDLGIDFLTAGKTGLNISAGQAILDGVKSMRVEIGFIWR